MRKVLTLLIFAALFQKSFALNYTPLSKEQADATYLNQSFTNLSSVKILDLNTSNTNYPSEGQIAFVDEQGGMVLGTAGGGVITLGAEMQTRVYNDTGATLSNGCLVTFSGRQGNNPKAFHFSLTNVAQNMVIGMVTEENGIPDKHTGDVTTKGLVRDVPNPSGFVSGAAIYASSTNGAITTNAPTYPLEPIFIGKVEVATGGTMDIQVSIDGWKTWAMIDSRYAIRDANESFSNLVISGNVTLTNTVWDDMTVSALTLSSGAAAPDVRVYTNGASTGAGIRSINYDSGDSAHGQIQFSHRKKRFRNVYPHVHYSTIDDRSAITNISFKLDCIYGSIYDNLTNNYSSTITITGTNAYRHALASFSPFGDNDLFESSIVFFEITCVEDGGANDKLFIHDIDFHYEIDKLGTNNELPDGM